MPTSPYLDQLSRAIDQSSDPATKGADRALRAGCYARHGDFVAAEQEIADLRAEFGDGRSGRVSILIMCAEAQLIYYRNLGEQARDRMMRAQLLSVAGRDASLSALTSAWLAHICFNLHRHEEMSRSAKTCLDTISSQDHEAASRLALTLGDAFYAADQAEIGNRWYTKAHERAVRLGDHSTIAALTYNRAALGTFCARIRAIDSPIDASMIGRLAGEVRTAINYQAIAQLTSLQALLDYSLASVHILAERHAEALKLLLAMVASRPSTSPMDRSMVLRCDLVLCLARTGDVPRAKEELASLPRDSLGNLTPDDQVVALAALREASALCADGNFRSKVQDALEKAKLEHAASVTGLRIALEPFGDAATLARI